MHKADTMEIQLLKQLETLTDRHGSFSLANPAAQAKMRAVVIQFLSKAGKK